MHSFIAVPSWRALLLSSSLSCSFSVFYSGASIANYVYSIFFSLCLSPARFYSSLLQCHANERTANKFPVYFFESIHNVPVVAIFAPSSISSSPCGPRQTNLRRVESYWRHCGLNKIRAWTDSVLRVDLICPTRPNIASSLKT